MGRTEAKGRAGADPGWEPEKRLGVELDHIQFVRERDGRWRPIGKTEMGRKTIEVLHLDGVERPKILDRDIHP
jgi:hypothetical protein